ncbi:MAG: hypothetical protein HC921_14000 [Synechococcaceae cyanobacterium SM2_3_1]|nr:hypothetical protein [Synechococcaceae cyanobacterium SM2_3_1]
MTDQDLTYKIGEALLAQGLITPQQLNQCLFELGQSGLRPEEICMLQGWATMEEIFQILPTDILPLGQLLLLYNQIRLDQLTWALRKQTELHQPLGQILVTKSWIDPEILNIFLAEQAELRTLRAANAWLTIQKRRQGTQRRELYNPDELSIALKQAQSTIDAQAKTIRSLKLNLNTSNSQPSRKVDPAITKVKVLLTELVTSGILSKQQAQTVFQSFLKNKDSLDKVLAKFGINPQTLHFFSSPRYRQLSKEKGDFIFFLGTSGLLTKQKLAGLPNQSLEETVRALHTHNLLPAPLIRYLINQFRSPALPPG